MVELEEDDFNKMQQKAAAFDQIYDELYLDETTGEYSAAKPHNSVQLITTITNIVNMTREAPGA
jgi:hypothetical protein